MLLLRYAMFFICQGDNFGANDADNGIKNVNKKDGQDEDAALRTGGKASETTEDRSEKGVTEHATNVLAVMVDDGDTKSRLSAGINDNASNAIGGVEATQHRYLHSQVDTVRTCSSLKPFFCRYMFLITNGSFRYVFNYKRFFQMLCLYLDSLIIGHNVCNC